MQLRAWRVRCVVCLLLTALWSSWPGAAEGRLDRVLVYSNQARVFHAVDLVHKGGEVQQELADLPPSLLMESLKVESETVTVSRVQVVTARGQLPRQERAKGLLEKLEGVLDQLQDLTDEENLIRGELALLSSLAVTGVPAPAQKEGAIEGLFVETWKRVLGWMDSRAAKARVRLGQLADKRLLLGKELHKLEVDASTLDLGQVNAPVRRVTATLEGSAGRHRVTVSYLVPSVRWQPSYDLRYDPDRRQVEAVTYALVEQNTGEDWAKARLSFSTDLPTQLLAIPELPTWTVGRQRDFDPTPRRYPDPGVTPWSPPAPETPYDPLAAWVQQALAEARRTGGQAATVEDSSVVASSGEDFGRRLEGERNQVVPSSDEPAPSQPRPIVEKSEPSEDDMDMESAASTVAEAPPAPPAEPELSGAISQNETMRRASYRDRQAPAGVSLSLGGASAASEAVPWSDAGYTPPDLDPDLPAAAAKGYRYTLFAPGSHSVPAGQQPRRIPLARESFSVKPVYRILPGMSPWAYLMASVKNTTGRPILRGTAHLFSGTMFRGKSWVNTALPGHALELPLGVDDAVKVERHLKQSTIVEGVVFKDDVTEYTIHIEVANNHRYPIDVEVQDQVPLVQGEKVEVKGFQAMPSMDPPDEEGRVRFRGSIPASSVKKLQIRFQIIRPREWELRQSHG